MRALIMWAAASLGGLEIPSFTDQTSAAGLAWSHTTDRVPHDDRHVFGPGVAVADFDRDGYLDLFVQGGSGQNARLYINDRDGTFTDRASEWGIDLTTAEGSSASVGDVDGDGFLDIYAGAFGGRNYLFLNDGQGGFSEVGVASGSALSGGNPFDTYGGSFGDLDLDGDLDLAVVEWNVPASPGNLLFENGGSGVFSDITQSAGVFTTVARGFSAALVDMGVDRYPELLVVADFTTSQYYTNDTDDTFTRVFGNGTMTDENGMGCAIADYDGDGDLDWFVTSVYDDDGVVEANWGVTGNRLYRNEGGHQYTDVTDLAGVRDGLFGWGASFGDFNHDGLLDLAQTNGFALPDGTNPDETFLTDPSRLWLNTGDFTVGPTFMEVASQAGITHTAMGKGLVSFDADRDGDLDVFITSNRGDHQYFQNETDPAVDRWVQIDFVPPAGNAPDGVGAKVELDVGGVTYHRTVFGVPSYISQDPLRLHFGFPAAQGLDELRVTWPDGSTLTRSSLPTGTVLRIHGEDRCASIFGVEARHRRDGRIEVWVRFEDSSFDGDVVSVDVDGELHTAVVTGNRAALSIRPRAGARGATVTLAEPAGCFEPRQLVW